MVECVVAVIVVTSVSVTVVGHVIVTHINTIDCRVVVVVVSSYWRIVVFWKYMRW